MWSNFTKFYIFYAALAEFYAIICGRDLQRVPLNDKQRRRRSYSNGAIDQRDSELKMDMYPDRLDVLSTFQNKTTTLRLRKNLDLLANGYKEIHFENGRRIENTPVVDTKDFCYYEGAADGDTESHAAINMCNNEISGTVYLDGLRYEVSPNSTSRSLYLIPAAMIDDLSDAKHICGHKSKTDGSEHHDGHGRRVKRAPRQLPSYYKKYITWKDLYVEMVIVFDNSVYRTAGSDKNRLFSRAKELTNYVNSFYQPVNIKVALVGVEIWTESNRITVTNSGDATLDQFLRYRRVNLLPSTPNDHAQLITTVGFSGGVVGKAMKGTMCASELSGAVVTDHSIQASAVAATMAHEMGHNFGMEHDNDTCQCPQQRCIMAASTSASSMYWSSCSMEYMSWSIGHGSDSCLKNVPGQLFDAKSGGPVCGNGFVEDGEQCDCGLADACDNPCCNASTCQLAHGAVCASGECCDTSKCQYKAKATACRESRDECDLGEYCSGQSEVCPNDTFKQNGISCAGGQAYCYDGLCGSHDGQCKLIWGSTGKSSGKECYDLNTRGDMQGNCGYKRPEGTYSRCSQDDVMCGALQCSQRTERTQYGDPSLVRMAYTEIRYPDRTSVCYTVSIDLGSEDKDPGLVPNGAKCAQDKICKGRKCVRVSDIRAEKPCAAGDCSGNGVCNNFGHCHCNIGFGGSDCGSSGFGGSIDSGPASNGGSVFNIGLGVLIFVVVILPLLSAVLVYLYKKGKINPPRVVKLFNKKPSIAKKASTNRHRSVSTSGGKKPQLAKTAAATATSGTTTISSKPPSWPSSKTTTAQPTSKQNLTTTTPALPSWPPTGAATTASCAVTDESKSYPKPTINVSLQDGLLPVLAAIVAASNGGPNTLTSSSSSTAAPAAEPNRPKRPAADSLAKVHLRVDEHSARSRSTDHEEDDVILPSRRAPGPPPVVASSTTTTAPSSDHQLRPNVAPPPQPTTGTTPKAPFLPKPKFAMEENKPTSMIAAKPSAAAVLPPYSQMDKKPKPLLPPPAAFKPPLTATTTQKPAQEVKPPTPAVRRQSDEDYYDVVHPKVDAASEEKKQNKEKPIPKLPLKPSITNTQQQQQKSEKKPTTTNTNQEPSSKSATAVKSSAFVRSDDLKTTRLNASSNTASAAKKALLPPPPLQKRPPIVPQPNKETAVGIPPNAEVTEAKSGGGGGLVSKMAARFENV